MSAEGKPFTIITLGDHNIKIRLALNELALLDELFDIAVEDLGRMRTLTSARTARAVLYVCANRTELLKGKPPAISISDLADLVEPGDLKRINAAISVAILATFGGGDTADGDDGDGDGEKKSDPPGTGETPADKPSDPSG